MNRGSQVKLSFCRVLARAQLGNLHIIMAIPQCILLRTSRQSAFRQFTSKSTCICSNYISLSCNKSINRSRIFIDLDRRTVEYPDMINRPPKRLITISHSRSNGSRPKTWLVTAWNLYCHMTSNSIPTIDKRNLVIIHWS